MSCVILLWHSLDLPYNYVLISFFKIFLMSKGAYVYSTFVLPIGSSWLLSEVLEYLLYM